MKSNDEKQNTFFRMNILIAKKMRHEMIPDASGDVTQEAAKRNNCKVTEICTNDQ